MSKTIKFLQFGEGNFLRAFVDYMICEANNRQLLDGGVRVFNVRKTGSVEKLKANGCTYHLVSRGIGENGAVSETTKVDSIIDAFNPYTEFADFIGSALLPDVRFVISNTTEAGIYFDENDKLEDCPPTSFPAKLTLLLLRRFEHFNGDASKGLVMLPCELLERNGDSLKECVFKYAQHWNLSDAFKAWLENACVFCNTLVDRIVSGHPASDDKFIKDQAVLSDALSVVGEPYLLWVIESPIALEDELPFAKCGLNVVFTNDISPYRARKVVLLNAPHTLMTATGVQMNIPTVLDAVSDKLVGDYLQKLIFSELIETLDMPRAELEVYANEILNRFRNPYLEHQLLSIANNAIAKCKVRAIPSLEKYLQKNKTFAPAIMFGLASNITMAFANKAYLPDTADAKPLLDETNLEIFAEKLACCESFAGENFAQNADFKNELVRLVKSIQQNGIEGALKELLYGKIA